MSEEGANIRIIVERVRVEGNGAILLTGPSSCGKGEIAKSISHFLALSKAQHASMGDVLRRTIALAESDEGLRNRIGNAFGISSNISVMDVRHNPSELIEKARRYEDHIQQLRKNAVTEITQFDWLCYCVNQGLLIPDVWAETIIEEHFNQTPELREGIFVLDGYPRTTPAADRLLSTFSQLDIGIIKVIHLSITKDQMKRQAENRGRADDTDTALDSRYQFYLEKVQPCVDFLKTELGPDKVALIDAHQPVYDDDGTLDLDRSIRAVTLSVVKALGLPDYLLDLKEP